MVSRLRLLALGAGRSVQSVSTVRHRGVRAEIPLNRAQPSGPCCPCWSLRITFLGAPYLRLQGNPGRIRLRQQESSSYLWCSQIQATKLATTPNIPPAAISTPTPRFAFRCNSSTSTRIRPTSSTRALSWPSIRPIERVRFSWLATVNSSSPTALLTLHHQLGGPDRFLLISGENRQHRTYLTQ